MKTFFSTILLFALIQIGSAQVIADQAAWNAAFGTGDVTLTTTQTVTVSGDVNVTGSLTVEGSLTNEANLVVTGAIVTQGSGAIINNTIGSTIASDDGINFIDGAITNLGTIVAENNLTFSITDVTVGPEVTNEGTMLSRTGIIAVREGAVFNNKSCGSLETLVRNITVRGVLNNCEGGSITAAADFRPGGTRGAEGMVINSGSITATNNVRISGAGIIQNNGTITSLGSFIFARGGTVNNYSTGTIVVTTDLELTQVQPTDPPGAFNNINGAVTIGGSIVNMIMGTITSCPSDLFAAIPGGMMIDECDATTTPVIVPASICTTCAIEIPTMSQWGLFILGLILTCSGLVYIMRNRQVFKES